MSDPKVAVIACEGYLDRAFWSGLLLSRGWSDKNRGNPWEELTARPQRGEGIFRFDLPSKNATTVLVVPCNGKPKVSPEAQRRLRERSTRPLVSLLVCLDPDVEPTLAWAEPRTAGLLGHPRRVPREMHSGRGVAGRSAEPPEQGALAQGHGVVAHGGLVRGERL